MTDVARRVALLLLMLAATAAHAQSSIPPLLARAEQLVVVTTPDWDSTSGSLRRFSRHKAGEAWRAEGPAVPIVVGRTGLA